MEPRLITLRLAPSRQLISFFWDALWTTMTRPLPLTAAKLELIGVKAYTHDLESQSTSKVATTSIVVGGIWLRNLQQCNCRLLMSIPSMYVAFIRDILEEHGGNPPYHSDI